MQTAPPQQIGCGPGNVCIELVVEAPSAEASDGDGRENASHDEVWGHSTSDPGLSGLGGRMQKLLKDIQRGGIGWVQPSGCEDCQEQHDVRGQQPYRERLR